MLCLPRLVNITEVEVLSVSDIGDLKMLRIILKTRARLLELIASLILGNQHESENDHSHGRNAKADRCRQETALES